MRIELELWHLITLMVTVISAFWALAKVIAAQAKNDIKQQFLAISESLANQGTELRQQGESSRRLERELLDLKTELARDYVRREDFTRVIASFEVKVDNLRLTIERFLFGEGRARD